MISVKRSGVPGTLEGRGYLNVMCFFLKCPNEALIALSGFGTVHRQAANAGGTAVTGGRPDRGDRGRRGARLWHGARSKW